MQKTEMLENEPQAKVVDYGQLSNYQKRTIITIASKNIGIDRIAKLLKPLKFCTPETTLKVIEERKLLADEDFIQLKAKLLEPTADEPKQVDETEQTAEEPAQVTNEPTAAISEQAEEPAKRDKRMSEEETVMMIKMHLDGKLNAEIAEVLGKSSEQISKRLSYAKTTQKYGYLFGNEKPKGEKKMQQKTTDKCYVARGTGYTIVDAIGENITVNGNGILRELTKYFEEMGLDEFYGKVEVRITVLDKMLEMEISEE